MLEPEVLEKLRCNACHNYLSVLPIYSYGGEQHVCGRCPVDQDFYPQENVLYETVIRDLNFPCQYELRGCSEKVAAEHMKYHEANCSYRSYCCPSLIEDCDFEGSINEILDHFEADHPDSIFRNIELDIVNTYEKNYVYLENNETFVILLKCDKFEGKLYAQVNYLIDEKAAEKFCFSLEFSTKYKEMFYNVMGKITYSDLQQLDLNKPHQIISLEDLKNNLNNPATILCNININRKVITAKREMSHVEEDLLRSIECPVCFIHMVPPILQCVKGHSFCKTCHQQVEICPVCRQPMSSSQNFVLEALALKIGYPCKYQQFECPFYGKAHEIRDHEIICTYGPFSCIFENCDWKDKFEKLLDHVKQKHHDDYLDVNTITYFIESGLTATQTYVISKFGNLFKMVFQEDAGAFRWSLQLVGPDTDPTKYVFELDIKSPCTYERIYFKKMCNSSTEIKDAFTIRDSYIELTHDALEVMIDDDTLVFHCNIAQI